ncbi:MAG: hypothetical protein ACOYBR_01170 [Fluviibacter sp.]
MKKLLPLLMLSILASSPMANADDEATPLQLKVMQTRKFLKPSLEVSKAAAEDGESLGAQKCINSIAMRQQVAAITKKSTDGDVSCMFIPKISVFSHGTDSITRITYEITPNQNDTETTVRIKMLVNWKNPKPVTDPEEYAKRFKSMGDLIFIEAIPLTPAIQS